MQKFELLAMAAAEGSSPVLLENIYDKGDEEVQAAVVANRSCPLDLVIKSAGNASDMVRAAAASSGRLGEQDQLHLACDTSVVVHRQLASGATSTQALNVLANSADDHTRQRVAENEHTSHTALRKLSQDTNIAIANDARENGRARGLDVDAIVFEDISGDLADALRDMGIEPKSNEQPLDAAQRVEAMTSSDAEIRAEFAEREDLEPSEENLLAFDPEDSVVRAVARRATLREPVAVYLLTHKNPVARALACRVAPVVDLEKLVQDPAESVRMMVARRATTAAIQVDLANDESIRVRQGLASQARNLCDEVVSVLTRDSDDTVRKLVALNSEASVRYDGQKISDLKAWHEEGWEAELERRLTCDEYDAINCLVENYPGTFESLCKVAKTLV